MNRNLFYEEDIINWKEYGETAIKLCEKYNINYVVKNALIKEIENFNLDEERKKFLN